MTPDELADKLRRLPPRPIGKHGSIKSKCTECELVEAEDEIERLRTALAASEAKLEKARDALRPFVLYVHDDVRNSTDAFKLIRSRENGGGKLFAENFRLAATTLKDIT